jgi:hypothetical protein
MDALTAELNTFIIAHSHDQEFSEGDAKFLSHSLELVTNPFPQFYLLFKIHKLPLKTRPIVSVSGSTLHALGRWVDCQLQPLMKALPSFIASLWELKNSLMALPPLPRGRSGLGTEIFRGCRLARRPHNRNLKPSQLHPTPFKNRVRIRNRTLLSLRQLKLSYNSIHIYVLL